MSSEIPLSILKAFLSDARLGRYENTGAAVDNYLKNLKTSAQFYQKLHWLEVGLRNAINAALAKKYGPNWLESGKITLGPVEQNQIAKARQTLGKLSDQINENDIVAALSFGFWVNLFNSPYENIWRTCLRQMFVNCNHGLSRKEFRKMLHPLLTLRNRIAHYEPIIFMNLAEHEKVIDTIVQWLSDDIYQLIKNPQK